MDWFLYDRDLRREKITATYLAPISYDGKDRNSLHK